MNKIFKTAKTIEEVSANAVVWQAVTRTMAVNFWDSAKVSEYFSQQASLAVEAMLGGISRSPNANTVDTRLSKQAVEDYFTSTGLNPNDYVLLVNAFDSAKVVPDISLDIEELHTVANVEVRFTSMITASVLVPKQCVKLFVASFNATRRIESDDTILVGEYGSFKIFNALQVVSHTLDTRIEIPGYAYTPVVCTGRVDLQNPNNWVKTDEESGIVFFE